MLAQSSERNHFDLRIHKNTQKLMEALTRNILMQAHPSKSKHFDEDAHEKKEPFWRKRKGEKANIFDEDAHEK